MNSIEEKASLAPNLLIEPIVIDQDPDASERKAKKQRITDACRDEDLPSLVALSTSKWGLVDDACRRLACTDFDPNCSSISALADLFRASTAWAAGFKFNTA